MAQDKTTVYEKQAIAVAPQALIKKVESIPRGEAEGQRLVHKQQEIASAEPTSIAQAKKKAMSRIYVAISRGRNKPNFADLGEAQAFANEQWEIAFAKQDPIAREKKKAKERMFDAIREGRIPNFDNLGEEAQAFANKQWEKIAPARQEPIDKKAPKRKKPATAEMAKVPNLSYLAISSDNQQSTQEGPQKEETQGIIAAQDINPLPLFDFNDDAPFFPDINWESVTFPLGSPEIEPQAVKKPKMSTRNIFFPSLKEVPIDDTELDDPSTNLLMSRISP